MPASLSTRIEKLARADTLADGTPCRVISTADIAGLADSTGQPGRVVEIAALKNRILPDRYLRNRRSLSLDEQIQLLESCVGIVGLGGLGGLVTETLARLGVGRLHLVDGDDFEAHNLNRQLLSTTGGLDTAKAEAAVRRVEQINPGIEATVAREFLSAENALAQVTSCHLVVDCLDNIRSRFVLASAARQSGIPMVSAAVAGVSGHVTTIFPEDTGLETIYGPLDQLTTSTGEEIRLGCLAPGVNLIASLECTEVLKVLLGRKNTLQNRLLLVDLSDYTLETLQLS
ncbi:MAG: HesA/MoeB/ThiF family protein [Desulfosarcina sp.]|jgi:molybdopterin/thiamine biosynthesis adenylyltransferase